MGKMLDTFERYHYQEVSPMDFYSKVYRLDEEYLQDKKEEEGSFKTNPIGIAINKKQVLKKIMFRDEFERSLNYLQEAEFSILSGLTYFGNKNTLKNASKMFAMVFDIDEVTKKELGNFLYGVKNKVYPRPTFVVMSGHGIHVYYIFDRPISLYPKTKLLLKQLKYELTDLMWNMHTSGEKNKQFQGINQGFRIIGSPTKLNSTVRAFKSSSDTVSLSYMNSFVKRKELDFSQLYKENTMSIDEAKEKYPEWYENIVMKGLPKDTWTTHEGLYKWWLRKIREETTYGHRYYAVMALAIYAIKSNVSYEILKENSLDLIDDFNKLNEDEPFTKNDVMAALKCYDPKYKRFPRADIEKITGIQIPVNKRNYRKQEVHLMGARSIQEINDKANGTNWREGNGRPKGSGTKEKLVKEYIEKNPNDNPTEIARALNISRPTVYKYLN